MPDVFLSYSRHDQATARRFAEAFEREGLSVWWDQTLRSGENYDQVTESALREAKAVVVLWSKHSVDSRWVRAEATQADRNGTLVPVMIEPCNRPIMFELKHTAELAHWKGDAGDKAWVAFVSDVRQFVKKEAAGTPSPTVAQPVVRQVKRISPIAITIAAAALVIAAVLWKVNRAPGSAATPIATAATASSAAAKEVTLAVLPFADMSEAHNQEYLSDGLTEEILNQLAQIKALRVTGRTSSFSFKGKNEDLRVIGEKLGVANLLEGSIRKDGSELRITAQLINSKDGTHLWSQTYDRELSKVFVLQEEIARDVAKALSIKLDVGDMPRAQGGTTNLDAYEKYLRGVAAFVQTDMVQASQRFREAVALDPAFVEGWWILFATLEGSGTASEEKAKALDKLEALAPGSWHALLARGLQLGDSHQWSKAESAFEAAQAAAAPYFSTPVEVYHSVNLRNLGRVREAHEIWQPLIRADPLSLIFSSLQEYDFSALGHGTEALTELNRSKTLVGYQGGSDRDLNLALRLHSKTDATAVWAQYSAVVKQDPLLQKLFSLHADNAAASTALHQAFEDPAFVQAGQSIRIASWADYFGDKDLTLAALRAGLVDRKDANVLLLWLPWQTSVRTDPRFKDIVKELGLVDYWRSSNQWGDFCEPVGKDDFKCH
jgi:TolB-like protein